MCLDVGVGLDVNVYANECSLRGCGSMLCLDVDVFGCGCECMCLIVSVEGSV